jgi:phosphopantothenoylcysteine decarboxylase/phosphopantothenate--cysteine ligase
VTFLVTAGPTVEDIDPVRFISNRATGKLGAAVVAEILRRGERAVFVHGPIHQSVLERLPRSRALKLRPVRSAADMCRATLTESRSADVIIMSAAVADYTPVTTSATKLKKARQGMTLHLKPTVDILRELGRSLHESNGKGGNRPLLIGFALETGSGKSPAARKRSQLSEAQRKLRDKNLDAIVLDSPAAMGADVSDFTILLRSGERLSFRRISKNAFARRLVKLAFTFLRSARERTPATRAPRR